MLANELLYNPHIAVEELGLEIELILELMDEYIIQCYDMQDDFKDAIKSENPDDIYLITHRLKGVSANLRVNFIYDKLDMIEKSSDLDKNLEYFSEIYSAIDKIYIEIEDLKQELEDEDLSDFSI